MQPHPIFLYIAGLGGSLTAMQVWVDSDVRQILTQGIFTQRAGVRLEGPKHPAIHLDGSV